MGDRFYIIESGEVTVEERQTGDDEPRVLTRLFPGSHFGEYSLVRSQPRVASVIARGGGPGISAACTVVRSLDKATFEALVREDPAYSTVLRALVEETEATRRKREVITQAGGGARAARQVAFVQVGRAAIRLTVPCHYMLASLPVQSNKSTAKITRQARRGFNERRQEYVNNYTFLKQLGSGTYGRVHLCVDAAATGGSGRVFAIKVVDKAKLRRKRLGLTDEELLREVEVMKKLRHKAS